MVENQVSGLFQRAPEQVGWVVLVVGGEELHTRFQEFLFAQQTVVVCVNCLEGGIGGLGVQSEQIEEHLKLVQLNEAVLVGIHGVEEEWKGPLECDFVGLVLDHVLHDGDKCLLVNLLRVACHLQVQIPNLTTQSANADISTL